MTDQGPPAPASQSWRTVAVVALAALGVLLVGLGITVGLLLGDDDGDDGSEPAPSTAASTADESPSPASSAPTTPAELADVVDVATQFMTRVNTYGPELLAPDGTMPTYRVTVSELLTADFLADFLASVPAAEASVKDSGLSRTATITGSGLSSIDDDTATALVSGTVTSSSAGQATGDPAPFRSMLTLQQDDGTWLVDDFTPIDGSAQNDAAGLGAELEAPRAAAAQALEVMLAYDYRDMDAEAAHPLMTAAYWEEYEKLFEVLVENAPQLQAVVTAGALATAVTEVGDGYVDVLVFVDREVTTRGEGEKQHRDAVTARMVASPDGWLVDSMSTGSGGPG